MEPARRIGDGIMPLNIPTERLILKPHTSANLEWLNTLFNDTDENYYDGDDPPKTEPETLETTGRVLERILHRPADADIIDYAIHRREDDALIGCGMIALINRYNRRCNLGISMGCDKSNWGKGYGREALRAVIGYCFNELEMNRIEVEIYEFNARSIRLFEGLGFQREGVRREYIYKDEAFKDGYIYGLLRKDWRGHG
jgi:RimJ/RimL family protein N-acetyltransferase